MGSSPIERNFEKNASNDNTNLNYYVSFAYTSLTSIVYNQSFCAGDHCIVNGKQKQN